MKSNFEKPVINLMNIPVEGVYAASGTIPKDPTDPPDDVQPDWNIYCTYEDHNSGSLSVVKIHGKYYGSKTINNMKMYFKMEGYNLSTVVGEGVIYNGGNDFIVSLSNCGYGNGYDMGRCIQITVSNGQYHGAVGKTGGVPVACTITCTGYECS